MLNEFAVRKFSQLELLARQVVEGFITGLHKSPFHGFSVEFAEHRLYNTGESTRHIDWKLYGRTDKFFVKRYEEETNLRCQLVLDCSSSMFYPEEAKETKLTFSSKSIASLIYLLKSQRDAFGLTTFDDQQQFHTSCKSSVMHQKLIFAELERLLQLKQNRNKKTSGAQVLHQLAETMHRRSLVVIFSDMLENINDRELLFSALQHLKHNKHEIVIFHVFDENTEFQFDFKNQPYLFVDLESGREVKLNALEAKAAYHQKIEEFRNQVTLKCHQYKIDYIPVDIAKGFDTVLMEYLVKRSKMV